MWVSKTKIKYRNTYTLLILLVILASGLILYIINPPNSNSSIVDHQFDSETELATDDYFNNIYKKSIDNSDYQNDSDLYSDLFDLANNYYRAGQYSKCIEQLQKILKEIPEANINYMTHELLAMAYKNINDPTNANTNFDKAIELINKNDSISDKDIILNNIEAERK